MKKQFVLALLLILLIYDGTCQNGSNKYAVGFHINPNLLLRTFDFFFYDSYTTYQDYPVVASNIGISLLIYSRSDIQFETGLYYAQWGYGCYFDRKDYCQDQDIYQMFFCEGKNKNINSHLEIPVSFKYNFLIKEKFFIYVKSGLCLNYLVKSKNLTYDSGLDRNYYMAYIYNINPLHSNIESVLRPSAMLALGTTLKISEIFDLQFELVTDFLALPYYGSGLKGFINTGIKTGLIYKF